MNFSKLTFLLLFTLTVLACGDDEEAPTCTQSDWLGDYTGTSDCDGTVEDATITITASGTDAIIIEYAIPGLTSTYDPITPDGCGLDKSDSASGITLSVEATLDGDELTFKEVLSANGNTATCNVTVTRN